MLNFSGYTYVYGKYTMWISDYKVFVRNIYNKLFDGVTFYYAIWGLIYYTYIDILR